ncbi:MAG: DNA primase [Myxococcales bacterium]|nr:DNA primase [Myxococcales bacterium]
MAFPREVVEEVRARTDIAMLIGQTVALKRAGRGLVGLCPFHNEKSPSFNVVPHKQIYHCFGCGESGDAIAFVMKTRGLTFVEAVKDLAQSAGVTLPERDLTPEERARLTARQDLYTVCETAAALFHRTLLTLPEGQPGRDYLTQRGVTLETAQKYRLGFAPDGWDRLDRHLRTSRVSPQLGVQAGLLKKRESSRPGDGGVYDVFRNRLIFPILDDRDRPIAFGGRLLPDVAGAPPSKDPGPKYLNSPESPVYKKNEVLYGLSWARGHAQRKDRIILVEGYFDAVSLWQAGFGEAVATCGTALTERHVERVASHTRKVYALFDSDAAGLRAAQKSLPLLQAAQISAFRLNLGTNKDPDEFIQKNGAAAFEALFATRDDLVEMVVRRIVEEEGRDGTAKDRVVQRVIGFLRDLPNNAIRETAILYVAGLLSLRADDLRAQVFTQSDDLQNVPRTPSPERWVPPKDLVHLLWGLIRRPEEVAPIIARADPDWVTDRTDVLGAIVRIGNGVAFAEIVGDLDGTSPGLARTLRAIAAMDGILKEEDIVFVATDVILRMERAALEVKIRALNAAFEGCVKSGDKSSYRMLMIELSALKARRQEINAALSRLPAPPK